jgi:hypothetical protein
VLQTTTLSGLQRISNGQLADGTDNTSFGLVYRMEGVYRLLLHERKVLQDGTSDAKFHSPIQYERDVITTLGTTKWQVQTVKLSVLNLFFFLHYVGELRVISLR